MQRLGKKRKPEFADGLGDERMIPLLWAPYQPGRIVSAGLGQVN